MSDFLVAAFVLITGVEILQLFFQLSTRAFTCMESYDNT